MAAELGDDSFASVISVTECGPASRATSTSYSRSAQIRNLIACMRSITPNWLGVHVPREWNTDPDRLSHPSMLDAVTRDASARGFQVVRMIPPASAWRELSTAAALPLATEDLYIGRDDVRVGDSMWRQWG